MAYVKVEFFDRSYTVSCTDEEKCDLTYVVEMLTKKIAEADALLEHRQTEKIVIMAALDLLFNLVRSKQRLTRKVMDISAKIAGS